MGGRQGGREREAWRRKENTETQQESEEREKARGRQEETEIESSPDFLFFLKRDKCGLITCKKERERESTLENTRYIRKRQSHGLKKKKKKI